MAFDLAAVGRQVGQFVIQDVEHITSSLAAGVRWRGTLRYEMRGGGISRLDSPVMPPRTLTDVPARPRRGVCLQMHVRLEPGVSLPGPPGGEVVRLRRVLNLNAVGMCHEWQDRGLFTGMINVLEAYVRSGDRPPGTSAQALYVSSISNLRLGELLDRRGWEVVGADSLDRYFTAA